MKDEFAAPKNMFEGRIVERFADRKKLIGPLSSLAPLVVPTDGDR